MASEEYEQARRRKGKPMHQLGDECVLFAFARDLEPALRVASGDTVRIRTQDCFGNQVRTSLTRSTGTPSTRPRAPCTWREPSPAAH